MNPIASQDSLGLIFGLPAMKPEPHELSDARSGDKCAFSKNETPLGGHAKLLMGGFLNDAAACDAFDIFTREARRARSGPLRSIRRAP
jgi:hypothetical protein